MTKKELLHILKDVPDDAYIDLTLNNDEYPNCKICTHIGQIFQDLPATIEGEFFPGSVTICPTGHRLYYEHPSVHLPEGHPDHDPDYDFEPERRILYDSVNPEILTPMLDSEKKWPIHQQSSLAE